MKYLKHFLALLVVALLVTACGPSQGGQEPGKSGQQTEQKTSNSKAPKDTLVVGVPSEMNGDFVTGFTNSAYDKWLRDLIYGGGTYATDEQGQFQLNEAYVEKVETATNDKGDKTYTFTLKDGLVWNDDTPITAKDYVYWQLVASSQEFPNAGAGLAIGSGQELIGYKDYYDGKSNSFPGIKLIDDKTFSITISHEELPYFFEELLASASPMPMHVWSPNLEIGEDGSSLVLKGGSELTEEAKKGYIDGKKVSIDAIKAEKKAYVDGLEGKEADAEKMAKFDADVAALEADVKAVESGQVANPAKIQLQADMYEVAKNYRYKPTVTCGLYDFVSFENNVATVKLNPKSAGNFRGEKPTIEKVEMRVSNPTLLTDQVISGEVDLNLGVVEGEQIEKAKSAQTASVHSYSRNGYGMISFVTDAGATAIKEVRQALAYLIDRAAIVQSVLGGYGVVGNGWYGESQWTYQMKKDELNKAIVHYALDFDAANKKLDETDYIYEADGKTPWSAEKANELVEKDAENFDYYRYNSKGEKLVVNHYGTENNPVTDAIVSQLPPNGKKAGLQYNVTIGDFATLLNEYYNRDNKAPEDRQFTAFNLATSFYPYSMPYNAFHSDFYGTPSNNNGVKDPKVDELSVKMKQTASGDNEKYADLWLQFQIWFNDYLPTLPLYSNEYYDVFNNRVKGLETGPDWQWTDDICDLRLEG